MKGILYILITGMFMLISSCGDDSSKEDSESKTDKEIIQTVPSGSETPPKTVEADNCQEFLDKYEAWADDYIQLLATFTSNPADPGLAKEYNKLTREYSNWTNDWLTFVDCAEEADYMKRYEAINKKIEKQQQALRGG